MAMSANRMVASYTNYPLSNHYEAELQLRIKRRIDEFRNLQTVSLKAIETLRAVVLVCLSLTVMDLINTFRMKLIKLMDNAAITERNLMKPC